MRQKDSTAQRVPAAELVAPLERVVRCIRRASARRTRKDVHLSPSKGEGEGEGKRGRKVEEEGRGRRLARVE